MNKNTLLLVRSDNTLTERQAMNLLDVKFDYRCFSLDYIAEEMLRVMDFTAKDFADNERALVLRDTLVNWERTHSVAGNIPMFAAKTWSRAMPLLRRGRNVAITGFEIYGLEFIINACRSQKYGVVLLDLRREGQIFLDLGGPQVDALAAVTWPEAQLSTTKTEEERINFLRTQLSTLGL